MESFLVILSSFTLGPFSNVSGPLVYLFEWKVELRWSRLLAVDVMKCALLASRYTVSGLYTNANPGKGKNSKHPRGPPDQRFVENDVEFLVHFSSCKYIVDLL